MHIEPVNVSTCGLGGGQPATIGETSVLVGEMVCVDVTAAQFQDLDSLLLVISVEPGLYDAGQRAAHYPGDRHRL